MENRFKNKLRTLKVGWKTGQQSGKKVRMAIQTLSLNKRLDTKNNKNRPK